MPNWCDNKLEVNSTPETLDKVIEFVTDENGLLDFNKIVPQPEFENDTDWYHWRLDNWGTQWNASNPVILDTGKETSLEILFQTAWSPALPVTRALSERFPHIYFTHWYEEMGMDFSGYVIFKDGETVYEFAGDFNQCWKYFSSDGEELLDRHDAKKEF